MMISDSHNDFLTSIETKNERESYVKEMCKCEVKNISCSIFTTEKSLGVKDVEKYNNELTDLKSKFNINLLLSIEDLGCIKCKEDLDKIIQLKPFSVTFTWNCANQFGGGAHSKLGLTGFGKQCVNMLESNNILIDTAHMSRRAFWDFCKLTTRPIFNSHSNIYNLKKHCRNLTDKQIEKNVESNGYLGITLYDKFISNNKISSKDIALQFDYLIKKFGYKNFGLGTDFYGIDNEYLPKDIETYNQISNIETALKEIGYDDRVVNCLMYKNFEDFLKRIE